MNTVVLTGRPSSGKTAVVNRLAANGETVVPEAARLVIDEWISAGGDQDRFRGSLEFQRAVERTDRVMEMTTADRADGTVFLDRSMVDNIAFREAIGHPIPDHLEQWTHGRYDEAVILEPLPGERDYARDKSPALGDVFTNRLRDHYEGAGANVTRLGNGTVSERLREVPHAPENLALAIGGPP